MRVMRIREHFGCDKFVRTTRTPHSKIQFALGKEVSTTRGSGWVRSRAATDLDHRRRLKAAHPSATADGTDLFQDRKKRPRASVGTEALKVGARHSASKVTVLTPATVRRLLRILPCCGPEKSNEKKAATPTK